MTVLRKVAPPDGKHEVFEVEPEHATVEAVRHHGVCIAKRFPWGWRQVPGSIIGPEDKRAARYEDLPLFKGAP